MSTHISKLAPVRSSLLTKHIRGTLYFSACRQTVSDCGSTPATPSKQATPPSSTRKLRSTSMVKSTWPGVSMMLMRCSGPAPDDQKQVDAGLGAVAGRPEAGGGGAGDGDPALLHLRHPVHRRGALMVLADLVGLAGVV